MTTRRQDTECGEEIAQLQCPNCDSTDVEHRTTIDRFQYGTGDNAVELTATIPISHCRACDLEYSGDDAERIRHDVICAHLQLLSPHRIAEVRASYGLSRAKFAEISRIGMATLARWENGETLQNAAMDMYMRLLARQEVYDLVASRAVFASTETLAVTRGPAPTFQALGLLGQSEQARLRAAAQLFDFAPKIYEAA
jgi:putative zinc finger/helix-turn-helix YgiT family protein